MGNYFRQHPWSFALSVLLHGALAAALIVSIDFEARAPRPAPQLSIQATVVDPKAVQQEMQRLDEQKQAEARKQQEKERAAREAREEKKRKEQQIDQLRVQREKAERLAQEKREREAAEEKKREDAAQAARKAEEKRKREAEQQRLAEEKRKAAAAARRQKELNAQLQADIAAEERRRKAEQSGLLDQYVRLIQNRIEQQWIKPPSARPGLECVVDVTQIPSGTVVNVHVRADKCNGDAAVRRSIETAVLKASPLPKPPVPELFERNLVITFHPDEVG